MASNTPQDSTPNRSADKAYYRSKSVSAINNHTVLTRRGRPGTPLQVDRTPHQDVNDTNTDRYYRSGGSRYSQRGQPAGKLTVPLNARKVTRGGEIVDAASGRPAGSTYAIPQAAGLIAVPVRVRDRGDVAEAKDAIFAAVARGEPRVFVQVADAECERRIVAAIQLGVARGQITEERVRDVSISLIAASGEALAKQLFGEVRPPDHVETVERGQTGNAAEIDDMAAFVKGDGPDDDNDDFPEGVAPGVVGVTGAASDGPQTHAAAGEGPEGRAPADDVQRVSVRPPTRGRKGRAADKDKPAAPADPAPADSAPADPPAPKGEDVDE